MEEEVVPVCAPSLLAPRGPLRAVTDLGRLALLHHRARPRAWKDWLQLAGGGDVNPFHGVRFEQFEMIIQAAISGMGMAIVPRFMIEAELAEGKLIAPFAPAMKSPESYYLVCPERKRDLPAVQAFRQWVLAEMRVFHLRRADENRLVQAHRNFIPQRNEMTRSYR